MKNRIEQILVKRGYYVSEDGKMYNPSGKEIGKYINNNGYHSSGARVKGKRCHVKVHRLQAFQKYGQKLYNKGIVTRHKNGNPLDNSWDNILIGTQSQNMMDVPQQVRIKKALHATSFIRKYDKDEVISFHEKSKSYKKTMEEFEISSKGTLHFILNN